MMIKYISKDTSNLPKILLANSNCDFRDHITDPNQLRHLNSRLENEKKVNFIYNESPFLVVILKDEKKENFQQLESARKLAHSSLKPLIDNNIKDLEIVNLGVTKDEFEAFTEGLILSNYAFNKYFTKKDKAKTCITNVFVSETDIPQSTLIELNAVLSANFFSRDLVNEPLSYLTATKLAEEIQEKGKTKGFSVEVFNKKKIETLRMGGLLAVNKGSIDPPTFSVLEWKPDKVKNEKPYVLVGKGVVYDTGGLSLKPTADSMDYMKCDMAGAAAVAGIVSAIAEAKLPIHIIGLIPASDNRPDGNAYVPGDVVTMHDGSTVEVLNTDAEGRMLLADALSYAKQYNPELVIELSTLTGAAHAAVGKYAIVGMGNAGDEIMSELKTSGFKTFERIAEFPFWDDFSELLKSDIADQKNIGGRYAGAITAGKFLEKFTDYPYVHLDIAGPSYNKQEDNYRGLGGSGVGVRLLFNFFKNLSS